MVAIRDMKSFLNSMAYMLPCALENLKDYEYPEGSPMFQLLCLVWVLNK